MAVLIFLVIFPLICYGISIWIRQQKKKQVQKLEHLAEVARGVPTKAPPSTSKTPPTPARTSAGTAGTPTVPTSTSAAPARTSAGTANVPAVSAVPANPATGTSKTKEGAASNSNEGACNEGTKPETEQATSSGTTAALDTSSSDITKAQIRDKDTLLEHLRNLFEALVAYRTTKTAANTTCRQIKDLLALTATDRIRPDSEDADNYDPNMPKQMLQKFTISLLALSSRTKEYVRQIRELREAGNTVQKARQRLLNCVSSLESRYRGKYQPDLESKLQAAQSVLTSGIVRDLSPDVEAFLKDHAAELSNLPEGFDGEPLNISNSNVLETNLAAVFEKRFVAYRKAGKLDNSVTDPLLNLQKVPANIALPARPTVEEVSRFVTQFENWSKSSLLSLRAAQEHRLEAAAILKEFHEAIDTLRKGLIKYSGLKSARSEEEALIIVASRFLETSEERYKNWLNMLDRLEKLPLESSLPVSTSTEAELAQMEALRQLLRKLGFAVAQHAIAVQKRDSLAYSAKRKSAGPASPKLYSVESYDSFMKTWEQYEADFQTNREEFIRLQAEMETIKAATQTRLTQRHASAKLLIELATSIAASLTKSSSDELRTVLKAAQTMSALFGDENEISNDITLAMPAGKA